MSVRRRQIRFALLDPGHLKFKTMEDNEMAHTEEVEEHIRNYGLTGIEEFLRAQLEEWENVEIKIGIKGQSGVGKSSFINAIRG